MTAFHRKEKLSLIGMYVAYYAPGGFLTPFVSVYLKYQAGFDDAAVGSISALGLLFGILGQFALGYLSDNAASKNAVLNVVYVACALSAVAVPANGSFAYTAAMLCALYFFLYPIQPLTDTIVLENCAALSGSIGGLRLTAVLSCALTSLVGGAVIGATSPSVIFFLFAVPTVLGGIPALLAPRVPGHQTGRLKKIAPTALFKIPPLMLLMAAGLFVHMTIGYYTSFFPVYYTSPAVGGSAAGYGLLNALSMLAEIPVFMTMNRILKKISIEKALAASMLLWGVRWLLIALIAHPGALVIVNLIHGISFAPFFIFAISYIDRYVGPELKASGQTLYCVFTTGFGRMVGSFAGGLLARYMTHPQMYLVSAVLCVAAGAVFYTLAKRLCPAEGTEESRPPQIRQEVRR